MSDVNKFLESHNQSEEPGDNRHYQSKAEKKKQNQNDETEAEICFLESPVTVGHESQNQPVTVKRRNGHKIENRQNQIHKNYKLQNLNKLRGRNKTGKQAQD